MHANTRLGSVIQRGPPRGKKLPPESASPALGKGARVADPPVDLARGQSIVQIIAWWPLRDLKLRSEGPVFASLPDSTANWEGAHFQSTGVSRISFSNSRGGD